MRLLLDQGTLAPLRQYLTSHRVETAAERGWSTLKNGELLNQAEAAGFQVLITTDQNLKHQQNLAQRPLAVLVLSTTSWPRIQKAVTSILQAIESITPGGYVDVTIA